MKNALLIAVSMVMAVEAASAAEPKPHPVLNMPEIKKDSEIYLGALVGYNRMSSRMKNTVDAMGAGGQFVRSTQSANKSSNSPLGGALVGVRKFYGNFNMGLDVEFGIDRLEIKQSANFRSTPALFTISTLYKVRRQYYVIPSIRANFQFSKNWWAGLGIGLGISRFSHKAFADSVTVISNVKRMSTNFSFVPSVKLEYDYNQRVSFFGTVSVEFYPNIKNRFGSELLDPPAAVFEPEGTSNMALSPTLTNIKVGILFKL